MKKLNFRFLGICVLFSIFCEGKLSLVYANALDGNVTSKCSIPTRRNLSNFTLCAPEAGSCYEHKNVRVLIPAGVEHFVGFGSGVVKPGDSATIQLIDFDFNGKISSGQIAAISIAQASPGFEFDKWKKQIFALGPFQQVEKNPEIWCANVDGPAGWFGSCHVYYMSTRLDLQFSFRSGKEKVSLANLTSLVKKYLNPSSCKHLLTAKDIFEHKPSSNPTDVSGVHGKK